MLRTFEAPKKKTDFPLHTPILLTTCKEMSLTSSLRAYLTSSYKTLTC